MRARWLKPEFFRDRKIACLSPLAALVYQGLWVLADDGGVAPADPEAVHSLLFFRWSAAPVPKVTGALRELYGAGRLVFYRPGDDLYALIPTFRDHQSVHKPSAFRNVPNINDLDPVVPEWCGGSAALVRHSPPPRHLDTQTPRHLDTSVFEVAWKAYPKRPNNPKAAAKRAWTARLADGVSGDAMLAGVLAYAAYVEATRTEPRFVKMASTFFGPDEHYLSDYSVPPQDDPYEAARKRLEAEEAA